MKIYNVEISLVQEVDSYNIKFYANDFSFKTYEICNFNCNLYRNCTIWVRKTESYEVFPVNFYSINNFSFVNIERESFYLKINYGGWFFSLPYGKQEQLFNEASNKHKKIVSSMLLRDLI